MWSGSTRTMIWAWLTLTRSHSRMTRKGRKETAVGGACKATMSTETRNKERLLLVMVVIMAITEKEERAGKGRDRKSVV